MESERSYNKNLTCATYFIKSCHFEMSCIRDFILLFLECNITEFYFPYISMDESALFDCVRSQN